MTSRQFCDSCGDELETLQVISVSSRPTSERLDFCTYCAGVDDDRGLLEAIREGFDVADE